MNMHDGIKHSCDCYFYEVARRAGVDAIARTAREFGLGKRYPIGLEGVAAGIVPTEAWKLEKRKSAWNPGETLITGIGQGFIITSPLQLAVMTARIASGRAVEPRLTRPAGETEPAQFPRLSPDITDAMLKIIQDGMYGVSNEPGGTAVRPSQLDLGDVKMAGKTGTAQVRRITLEERARGVRSNDQMPWNLRDHALFVCYAPTDRPRYACAVVVDHGGGGSKAAAPIARDVMRQCLMRNPGDKPVFTPRGRTAGLGPAESGRGA
jgi:penicillin-binding protein 2